MNARTLPRFVLPLFLLLGPQVASAKPIYITVPRTFSTGEAVVVDLAFSQRESVELRLLRPEKLEDFVRGEADLRRAYDPPALELNPGRHLARGLNAVRNPGTYLLFSMNAAFRKALAPKWPERPAEDPRGSGRPLSRLREGPAKLIGIPPGMAVVRREWLNLDLGGRMLDFSVPGFDEWGGGGYEQRRLSLGALPSGVYVLQLVAGRVEGQALLVVTDLAAAVKQTDGGLLVRVAGRDQRPRAEAEVTVLAPGAERATAKTDARGEARIPIASPRAVVMVTSGTDVALVDTDFYSTLAVAPDVFVYSDRPIYRPGDEVLFRGLVRRPDSFLARMFSPKKREVAVRLVSSGGPEVKTKVTLDDFGAFSGKVTVPKDLATGVLRIVAELDGAPHEGEARVQEYVKPTFYLEIESATDGITPGETLSAKIRARRYSGGIPENTGYQVFLYRTRLESPSWVDDAGLGGEGSRVTYGSASTTEGQLSIPERLFASTDADEGGDGDPWSRAARFDAAGEAEVAVPVPTLAPGEERLGYKYILSVRARDDQETFASAGKTFFLAGSDVMGALAASAKVAEVGSSPTLSVKSLTLGGQTAGEISGEVELVEVTPEGQERALETRAFTTDRDGVYRGPIPTPRPGAVRARVTLKDARGRPWTDETRVWVAGSKGETVARVPALVAESLSGMLEPGDTARLVALFPDAWGPGGAAAGPVWLTLTGSEIFETRLLEISGQTLVHTFDVERRFGSAVYASLAYPTATGRWEERTVPFRIVPRERTLRVSVEPEVAEAAPLGAQTLHLQVRDARGRGVEAELSVGVVDKAIYALQTEIRPSVLDFFYPLGRDNVMSFYSAEFQSYGYGELIARHGLPSPYALATVKPPTRVTKDRDTAYWSPSVITDRDGRATVRFDLPSNSTLWTVTAVAADASGRFGEGRAEFATRGALSLTTATPPYLRRGDEAVGSVRVSRGTGATAQALTVDLGASGVLEAAQVEEAVALDQTAERVIPMTLKAREPGRGVVEVRVRGGVTPIRDRREVPVHPNTVEESVFRAREGAGALTIADGLPEGAQVQALELVLAPTILEAALVVARDLLTYPFGCLEQLVSTTLPNVALARTLERIQALDGLDLESRRLLAEARSRATQGVARILDLSLKSGGFTWWSGESTPSVELTVIALDGLASAVEAGLADPKDPRITTAEKWLAAQVGLEPALEAARVHALTRLGGPRYAAEARALLANVDLGDPARVGLAVLAAENARITAEAGVKAQFDALVNASRTFASQDLEGSFPYARYFRYPLRPLGLQAILRHAAAASYGDEALVALRRSTVSALSRKTLSTFDRAQVLLHSLWLIERDRKALLAGPPPEVTADGPEPKVRLLPRGTGWVARLDPRVRTVTLGAFDGTATLTATFEVPLGSVAPRAEGMSLTREYFLLESSGKRRLEPGQVVHPGDEIYVQFTLDARAEDAQRSTRSAYYFVEDGVPAGFEPLVEDKIYRGAPHELPLAHEALKRRALGRERATFFFEEPTFWSQSPRVFGYVLRAAFAGRFVAPPATIEDMYASRVRGRTGAAELVVAPASK